MGITLYYISMHLLSSWGILVPDFASFPLHFALLTPELVPRRCVGQFGGAAYGALFRGKAERKGRRATSLKIGV